MNGETMSEQRFIIKNSNTVSSNYPSERVYDNKVKRDLYNSEIVIMLNKLWEENEQLRHELDSLTGCYCADNKEFKDYWRIGYDD